MVFTSGRCQHIVDDSRRHEMEDITNYCEVVDLFCGVGGLTHGFVQEKFKVVAGYDSDSSCKYAYETNNPGARFVEKKIESTSIAEIGAHYTSGKVKVLVGCAPCQPFSQYTVKRPRDEKWKLLESFQRIIAGLRPDIISMENVPELTRHSIFEAFVRNLRALDYHVSYSVVFCPDYGVPQSRRRLVLFASKFGEIAIIKKTHARNRWRTVRHAIGNLEPLVAGGRSRRDRVHSARAMNDTNLKRIRHTKAGGSWQDWPAELKLACHKRESGATYRSIYGRMEWDEPAPTLTTHCTGIGNGRYGHPKQDRAISLREAALLQSFPSKYKFVAPRAIIYNKILSRQIGNAVPVRLGRIIARTIKKHLESTRPSWEISNGSPHPRTAQSFDVVRANQRYADRAAR